MSETFKYDAFISYRHLEPDQFIAKQLHKELETFRLPGNIARKRKDGKTKISRVFRDQEELPLATNLEEPIIEALKQSEWLIVICSPRLRESIWCQKEIETFINFRGRDHILTVLAEGEPRDSFPEQLLYREYQVTNADGTVETVREKIEPLAADFRGETNKERLKAIKNEVLRLIAPMFGLEYDDLKQRHRERKMKRIIAGVSLAAVTGILFGIVSTFTAIRIQQQKEQIQEQADRIQNLAVEISEQSQEIAAQNETLRATQSESLAREALDLLGEDDREGALELAYYAMTEYEGIEMPYTPMAQRVLSSSLYLYGLSSGRKPLYQIETEGTVKFVICNPIGDKVVIADESGTFTCWSVEEERVMWAITTDSYMDEDLCAFLSDDIFCLAKGTSAVVSFYDAESGQLISEIDAGFHVSSIQMNPEEEALYLFGNSDIAVYDVSDCANGNAGLKASYLDCAADMSEWITLGRVLEPGIVAVVLNDQWVKVVDMNRQNEVILECEVAGDEGNDILLAEDMIYILSSHNAYGDDSFRNVFVTISAYDYAGGSLQWQTDHELFYGEKLYYMESQSGRRLVVIGSSGAFLCDPATGEEIYKDNTDDNIIWSEQIDNGVYYLLETGSLFVIVPSDLIMGSSKEVLCNVAPFIDAVCTDNAFFMVPYGENRVIFYAYDEGDRLQSLDVALPEEPSADDGDYLLAEEAEKLGVENVNAVKAVVYDEDKEYALVSLEGCKIRIYRVSDGEVVCEERLEPFEVETELLKIDTYLGTDQAGNSYWASSGVGLCFDPEYNLIGIYPMLRAVDPEKNILIFGSPYNEERYWAPIYSTEELLQIAERYLLEHHVVG